MAAHFAVLSSADADTVAKRAAEVEIQRIATSVTKALSP
jgi:hypothetical protein